MRILKSIVIITLRELQRIGQDHSLLLTLLIAPVIYLFFYGSIYSLKEEEKVKLALVDRDQTALSRMLTQQINNLQMVDAVLFPSLEEAKNEMKKGTCQGYIYIDKGLEERVLSLRQADVQLAVNAARFLPSSDLVASVTKICLAVSAGVRLQYYEMQGLTSSLALKEALPVNLNYRPLFNDQSSYGAFLLPGLLMLILQQTLLLGLAESVAGERMKKTIPEWFALSRGSVAVGIIGKGLIYFLLFASFALFALTINFSVFNLPLKGNLFTLALCVSLFLLSLIPMALWVGSFFTSQLVSLQVLAFSSYPIFLITGYSWPLDMLPWFIRGISNLLPTTPFMHLYISVTQQGGSLGDNITEVGHLFILLLLYGILCHTRFRHLASREQ